MRRRIGWWLRRLADRIDYEGAPKCMGWAFTIEPGEGIVFNDTGGYASPPGPVGTPLWYLGDAEYERAHTHAGQTRPGMGRWIRQR